MSIKEKSINKFKLLPKYSDQINRNTHCRIKSKRKYQNSFLLNFTQTLHFCSDFFSELPRSNCCREIDFARLFTQLQSHNRVNIGMTQNGLSIFVSNDSIGVKDFMNRSRPEESRLCNSNEKKNVMRGLSINSLPPPLTL